MHHDVHGHDSGAEAAGAASWMVAMLLVVFLTVLMIVALFAWAPWDNNGVFRSSGTNTERNVNPNNPDTTTQPQRPQTSP